MLDEHALKMLDEKGKEVAELQAQLAAQIEENDRLQAEIRLLKGIIQQSRAENLDEL